MSDISGINKKLLTEITRGYVIGVQEALDQGADPNTNYSNWGKPLDYAVEYGYVEAARTLLKAGAEITERSRLLATSHKNFEIINLFRDHDAEKAVLARKKLAEMTADEKLMQAVVDNNLEQAEAALLSGADPNTTKGAWNKRTVLHRACYAGEVKMVRLLLEAGADQEITIEDDFALKTPLDLAVEERHFYVAALLRKAMKRIKR